MPQTRTEWTPAPETVEADPRENNGSKAVLWFIALVAVTAAFLAWYQGRSVDTVPLVSEPAPIIVPVDEPTATTAPAAPESHRADESHRAEARRKASSVARIPRMQPARPLAGNPTPKYPAAALRAGVGGTVLVRAQLDASGTPVNVEIVERSGSRDLDRAALTAVRKWRFAPAVRNGKAVSSTVQVPVDFRPI